MVQKATGETFVGESALDHSARNSDSTHMACSFEPMLDNSSFDITGLGIRFF